MQSEPVIPPLVDQLIPQRSLAVVYGEPGSGKSFLVLDLACCIAAGIPWHGRDVQRGPVVYVAAEGRGGMPSRLAAWKVAHEASGVIGVHFLPESVRLTERAEVDDLLDLIAALPELPVLVIFDTLARSMSGADENSGKDMSLLIEAADKLRSALRCTVLFVHHPTKGNKRDERGSGQLRGAADMMAVVVRRNSLLTIECEKPKDYSPFHPIKFKLLPYLDSCVVVPLTDEHAPNAAAAAGDRLFGQERSVLRTLLYSGYNRLSSGDWKSRCSDNGVPGSTFYDVSERLVERGLVSRLDEGRRVWYAPTESGRCALDETSNGPTA